MEGVSRSDVLITNTFPRLPRSPIYIIIIIHLVPFAICEHRPNINLDGWLGSLIATATACVRVLFVCSNPNTISTHPLYSCTHTFTHHRMIKLLLPSQSAAAGTFPHVVWNLQQFGDPRKSLSAWFTPPPDTNRRFTKMHIILAILQDHHRLSLIIMVAYHNLHTHTVSYCRF